jgi:hypothetical protein
MEFEQWLRDTISQQLQDNKDYELSIRFTQDGKDCKCYLMTDDTEIDSMEIDSKETFLDAITTLRQNYINNNWLELPCDHTDLDNLVELSKTLQCTCDDCELVKKLPVYVPYPGNCLYPNAITYDLKLTYFPVAPEKFDNYNKSMAKLVETTTCYNEAQKVNKDNTTQLFELKERNRRMEDRKKYILERLTQLSNELKVVEHELESLPSRIQQQTKQCQVSDFAAQQASLQLSAQKQELFSHKKIDA